jgi:magnesium chelatase subunit D
MTRRCLCWKADVTVTDPAVPTRAAVQEGALREHLLDRIAIALSADVPQSLGDRVLAIDAAMSFQVGGFDKAPRL